MNQAFSRHHSLNTSGKHEVDMSGETFQVLHIASPPFHFDEIPVRWKSRFLVRDGGVDWVYKNRAQTPEPKSNYPWRVGTAWR